MKCRPDELHMLDMVRG